jgi:hypothetical protein
LLAWSLTAGSPWYSACRALSSCRGREVNTERLAGGNDYDYRGRRLGAW